MNFQKLKDRYMNDPFFNKLVNVQMQLLKEFGFLPDEIREGFFLAQYMFQMDEAQEIIRTQDDHNKIYLARKIMNQAILDVKSLADFDKQFKNNPPWNGAVRSEMKLNNKDLKEEIEQLLSSEDKNDQTWNWKVGSRIRRQTRN